MIALADKRYVKVQYKSSKNLQTRIQLHERFSVNQYDWFLWVFDQFKLPAVCRVLEVGCGTGRLWKDNLARIPAGWQITLSDFSAGMLERAKNNLDGAVSGQFEFKTLDVEQIPLPDESYDAVIANYMLYHVPNRAQALREIHRILKPGGKLYAATNGIDHLNELYDLIHQVAPSANFLDHEFLLENGEEQLAACFGQVMLHPYEDGLVVTEVEPLLAYILSGRFFEEAQDKVDDLTQLIERGIDAQGAIHITKSIGMFEAQK